MEKDYYAVLGLPANATTQQVRARFLELARSHHPDRFSAERKAEAEVEFQDITQAFNVLSDPERRREVDAWLAHQASGGRQESQAARVYLQRGIRAYRQKNYLEAAENFNRATREAPEDARAWNYLALAARRQRRWLPQARTAIDKACELEPMNADYLRVAGEIFTQSGMHARAERYLTEALKWGGADDPQIQAALAEVRRASGKKAGLFGRRS